MKFLKYLLLVALTLGFLTTPASAFGEKQFFMLPCDLDQYNGQLLNLSSDYATATAIGDFDYSSNPNIGCAGPAAYNMTDGFIYWISWRSNPGHLVKTDPTTGAATVVAEFKRLDGEPVVNYVDALTIGAFGYAYVAVKHTGIFRLDLANGELVEILLFDNDTYGPIVMYGLSYDPSRGTYIGVTDEGTVFDINLSSGTMTEITEGHYFDLIAAFQTTSINYIYELDFDNEGNAYAMDGGLKIVSASDYSLQEISQSELNLFGTEAYSESFAIRYALPEYLKAVKQIKGISNSKLSTKAKVKIRTFSETIDATEIVCRAKIKRNPKLSSSANRAVALKAAKKACAIVKKAHPDASTAISGSIATKAPYNYVKIVLKNIAR
jgi:hypothetical protein